MTALWYYAKGDKKHGPITEDQLQEFANSGELLPTDMVWQKGTKAWVKASTMPDLFLDDDPPPLENNPLRLNALDLDAIWSYCKAHPVRCAAAGFGIFFLLTLIGGGFLIAVGLEELTPLFIGPMLLIDFLLFVLLAIFGIKALLVVVQYETLAGKWNPVDGGGEPFEIVGKTITRGNLLVGTIAVQKDKRLEILSGGKVIEVWQLVKVEPKELVFQDASGKIKRYKKTITNPLAALFKTSRADHLQGAWQPITEVNEWVQFTKDGAVVYSDGSAGRYSVSGEEPNEVILMEMVDGQSRQFNIVSLSPSQLVISEGDEATTFRRPGKVKNDSGGLAATTPHEVLSGVTGNAKAALSGAFSYFTKWKCPNCGHRSAEKTGEERASDVEQTVQTRMDFHNNGQTRQMVVNCWTVDLSFRCNDCNHTWTRTEDRSRPA